MPRSSHGTVFTLEEFQNARNTLAERSAETPLGFAVMAQPVDLHDFGFLLPRLQDDPRKNLLPERPQTRQALVDLGHTMQASGGGDSNIPAAYTYFGQFVDHDITLETASAGRDKGEDRKRPHRDIGAEQRLRRARTAGRREDGNWGGRPRE